MKKETVISRRPSFRLDEKHYNQLKDLVELYQKESPISRVSVTDVFLHALDTLHEIKFPDREDDYDEE